MTILINEFGDNAMSTEPWTVADAKARFSEIIEKARVEGPQTVTRHGRPAAVIVSAEEWAKKTRRSGSLAAFFASSPLANSGVEIKRSKDGLRDVDL